MRIVAGQWRGRTLAAPSTDTTRPTSDKVRQALFNILAHQTWLPHWQLQGAVVADVCCGTGALGLEALSRGARRCFFIDHAPAALQTVRANMAYLKAEGASTVIAADVLALDDAPTPCDLVLCDPPYAADPTPMIDRLLQKNWLAKGGVLVLETSRKAAVPDCLPHWPLAPLATRAWGQTAAAFWMHRG